MRIALVARGCRPGAGIPLYTYELAKRLTQRHEVDVLTDPRAAEPCGATIVPIEAPRQPLWHNILVFSTRAGYEAQAGRYDIVHTQGSDATWGDVVTAHSCHRAGLHASFRRDAGTANRLRKWLNPAHHAILSLERHAYGSARLLLPVSRRVARQIHAAYPLTRATPWQVLYPGHEHIREQAAQHAEARAAWRGRLSLAPGDLLAVLLTHQPLAKGAARLVAALPHTGSAPVHALVTARGREARQLRRLARRLGVARRLHLIEPGSEALGALAAADAYVCLPEYESFGIALLEAMALGKVLLVSRNAGISELLRHGRDSLVLPVRIDPRELGAVLSGLARDDARRRRLGEAARASAQRFRWDALADSLESAYARVAAAKDRT